MWMPQFGLCFRGMSHIYPVFMRCVASVFVEAKLIARSHPALHYGSKGVQKTHLLDLISTAWFNLRVRRSTGEQWGMFVSVVLMLCMILISLGSFTMHVFFGVGNAVQAQLFLPNVFDHPGDPYGQGAGVTDITQGPGNITASVTPLFDARIADHTQGTGISSDYALMVLDKILRQSMTGPIGTGGILQNALTGIMLTYNTGMALLAGMITLWMVMSMVLATARAGTIGGGRHNMVWAPIRMVFALGIIMPLGAQGYSAGQYMVMKLAEWGSNLGTRGWVTYINGVVGDQTLLAPFSVGNATSVVTGINKIMVCQLAYNAILYQTTGALDPQQVIRVRQSRTGRDGRLQNRYTNDTSANICGSISYGDPNGVNEDTAAWLNGTGVTTPMDAASAAIAAGPARAMNTNYDANLATAVNTFRNTMMGALALEIQEPMDLGADLGTGAGGTGQTLTLARQLACEIVGRAFVQDPPTNPNPVATLPAPYGCGAGYTPPVARPTAQVPEEQVARLMDRVRCVFDGSAPVKATSPGCALAPGAKGALMTYITAGGMMAEMQARGWAGMGMWYQTIATLNAQIAGSKEMPVTVEPGTMWDGGMKDGTQNTMKCPGSWNPARECDTTEIEDKTAMALGEYDAWWSLASAPAEASTTPNGTEPVQERNYSVKPSTSSNGGGDGIVSMAIGAITRGWQGLATWVLNQITPRTADEFFIFNAVDVAATNTYPMATLVDAGHSLITWSLIVFGALSVIQILSSSEALFSSIGIGIAASSLMNTLSTMSMAVLMAGCVISFYLPVLPLLRVAFAVMTWMVSIFEAIVMVPIAALAHLGTEGEGLGTSARAAWILWLNVLMRPILVVLGFVGATLIFNTFAVYFHTNFANGALAMVASSSNPITIFIAQVAYSVIYMGILYTAANTSFKLLDIIPNNMMRWMGGVAADPSMDDGSDGKMLAAATILKDAAPQFKTKDKAAGGKEKPGASEDNKPKPSA